MMKLGYLAAASVLAAMASAAVMARLHWRAHAVRRIADASSPRKETQNSIHSRAWQHRFPNVELQTHEGKTVHFYDDLIKGKLVAINFMYATCKEF
jgi:cytochrome oxidase Cu insertion factor (SCO1/SenC/PrrC family)